MTLNEAKAFLTSIGYTPGVSATSEPKFKAARARIKKACAALKAAGVALELPAPVPTPKPEKPTATEPVAAEAVEAEAVEAKPSAKPKRARKPKPVTE